MLNAGMRADALGSGGGGAWRCQYGALSRQSRIELPFGSYTFSTTGSPVLLLPSDVVSALLLLLEPMALCVCDVVMSQSELFGKPGGCQTHQIPGSRSPDALSGGGHLGRVRSGCVAKAHGPRTRCRPECHNFRKCSTFRLFRILYDMDDHVLGAEPQRRGGVD